ncbi:hypothetical protein [Halomonas halocynthiae]|uniref:hypothetical protein n=1 Tax=Halomonas halocynthiae TaxID=176290 RepID=UPI0003F55B7A|nr:hypothetical protein [Halomonas halocynthiae]
MNFSISGIVAVLTQAIPPFLPLIFSLLAVLILVQLTARVKHYATSGHHCLAAALMAVLAGASAFWWLPLLTNSRLAFVSTVTDWAALCLAAVAIAIYAWLVLNPLSYLLRGAHTA